MDTIRLVEAFNLLLAALFTVLYFYQLVYLVLGLIHRRETKKADGTKFRAKPCYPGGICAVPAYPSASACKNKVGGR